MSTKNNRPTNKDIYELINAFRLEIKEDLKSFVTLSRFRPVESIAYGLVSIILLTVIAAILAQVIKAYL